MTDRLRSETTIVYVCLVFRTILVATLFDVLSPVLPLIGADLGVSQARFQAFFSAALMVGAAVLLGAPWLVDHIGRLRTVTVSAAGASLLGILSAAAQSYLAYAVALLAMFAVNAIGSVANRALMRDLLTHERYKTLFAYGQAALEATSIVAPLAAGWIAAAWGWRTMFAAFCMPLLAVPLLFAIFPPPASPATRDARPSGRAMSFTELTSLCMMARVPLILLCATQSGYTTLLVAKPFLLASRFSLSVTAIGGVLAGFAGIGVIGYLCSGALMARVSERSLVAAGILCQCLSALGLLLLSVTEAYALHLFLAALAAAQIGFCLIVPVANAWIMNVAAEYRAIAAGMLGGLQALSGGAVAFLAGIAYNDSALPVAVACTISALVAAVTLRRVR
ncbi:MFS transporter [Cupriavidus sp. BIC8F]|uniref:MFS transporter n=1 Tax=Cupriavidus sp. BIC8F TaxID=3079014 RepID=UPI002915EE50|nr:MFS transporter [Cupriavidus sp. BIC8F]